ncbi:MAG: DUF4350 domain-containing protein [Microbacterium sp.]
MTTLVAAAPDAASAPSRRRAASAWTAIALVLVLVGAAGAALTSATEWSSKGRLDPDSPAPRGTRALAQLLRDDGVTVDVVRTRAAAIGALGPETTLVLASTAALSDDTVAQLADEAGDVVLVDPAGRDLRLLFDGARAVGFGPEAPVDPDCAQADAARAGAVVVGALFATGGLPTTTGCYAVGAGYGLIAADRSATSRTVALDATALFSNEHLADDGNAALALGLMGRHERVVWFMPTALDGDAGSAVSLGDLTPPWVTPAIVLLLVAGAVAGVWRGRRFGPLVAENLPVTVRAAETMEGRARLYARSRDARHALDALRAGALDRIAVMLGLGRAASAAQIADAAAARIGARRDVVHDILVGFSPATDAELVAASDRLRDLEAAVRASIHLERIDP